MAVQAVRFYLGVHHPHWLERTAVPLFVSRRSFLKRERVDARGKTPAELAEPRARAAIQARDLRDNLPRARGPWCLDSGGFTELSIYGKWETSRDRYVADVRRLEAEIGNLVWVAPQDWMCEPFMLEKTGLSIAEHQRRTVENFVALRADLGPLVIPVLQGWTLDDYLGCWERYHQAGVELEWEPTIGVGSVCRRQNDAVTGRIMRGLASQLLGTQLHGFGVKLSGLESYGDVLISADSMAWSYRARRDHPLRGCTHKSCANCMRYALRWRDQVLARLGQLRLEVAA